MKTFGMKMSWMCWMKILIYKWFKLFEWNWKWLNLNHLYYIEIYKVKLLHFGMELNVMDELPKQDSLGLAKWKHLEWKWVECVEWKYLQIVQTIWMDWKWFAYFFKSFWWVENDSSLTISKNGISYLNGGGKYGVSHFLTT